MSKKHYISEVVQTPNGVGKIVDATLLDNDEIRYEVKFVGNLSIGREWFSASEISHYTRPPLKKYDETTLLELVNRLEYHKCMTPEIDRVVIEMLKEKEDE